MNRYADYGIDAPGIIKKLILGGFALSSIYFFVFYQFYLYFSYSWLLICAYFISISTLVSMIGTGLLMFWSSKVGKLRQRDKLIQQVIWRGDEKVLDVGCGRGLLLIAAAKKLNLGGKAIGIDIWSQEDLANNSAQATYVNANIEGVENRIEIRTSDVRNLSFERDYFDVVLSSLVIHNIKTKADRDRAIEEMLRVLKPGGTLLLQDIFYSKKYLQYLQQYKNIKITVLPWQWNIFPPAFIMKVVKLMK